MLRRLHLLLTIVMLVPSLWAHAQSYTPDKVPNVHLNDAQRYVSDPTQRLSAAALDSLDRIVARITESTTAEIAVVVLPAIEGDDPAGFSNDLFRLWGIGKQKEDNGLLLLYVYGVEGRALRFEVGYGLEGVLPDALTYQIGRNVIIPAIKEGDEVGGLAAGLLEIERVLLEGYTPSYYRQEEAQLDGSLLKLLLYLYLLFNALAVLFILFLPHTPAQRSKSALRRYFEFHHLNKTTLLGCLFAFMPLVGLIYFIRRRMVVAEIDRKVKNCPRCGDTESVMLYLDNQAEPYLTPLQRTEVELRSRTYLAGHCSTCGNVEVTGADRITSSLRTCPNCGGRTLTVVSRKRVSLNGLYLITYRCLHCDHESTKKHFEEGSQVRSSGIPPIIGGGFGSGGFGGGFGGGGSWGGGRSGGGGSTIRF